MNKVKFILLVILSVILCNCGGDKADEIMKSKKGVDRVPLSEIKAAQSGEQAVQITEVKFGSLTDAENDLSAYPVLSDKDAEITFRFRWFVNDNEIDGEISSTLSREFFEAGDWVHCRVTIDDQNEMSPEIASSRIRIKGPLPVLNLTDVEDFSPPGIFRYKINAYMPGLDGSEPEYGDEDEIDPEKSVKFELISPLDKGIILDSLSGEITWNITEELIEELGKKIVIKFSAISPSGRKVNSSITINLEESSQTSDNQENNPTLGSEIE